MPSVDLTTLPGWESLSTGTPTAGNTYYWTE